MSQLTWLLVKNNNAFLVKRDGVQFSREAFNLTNKNTFSASGLANSRAVDVSMAGGKIVMSTKVTTKSRKPKKSAASARLGLNCKRVNNCVSTQTLGNAYRADLRKNALARWTALNRSLKVDLSKPVPAKKKRGNK